MKPLVSKGVVLLASVLLAPATIPDQRIPHSNYLGDQRLARIQKFFRDRGSPAAELAEDFLVAADQHHLDWRLLPAISFVESGGGKQYVGNNIMGWGSAKSSFPNVRAGIHAVAAQVSLGTYYRNKNLHEKLRVYNPRPIYLQTALRVMRALGPEQLPGRSGSPLNHSGQPTIRTAK